MGLSAGTNSQLELRERGCCAQHRASLRWVLIGVAGPQLSFQRHSVMRGRGTDGAKAGSDEPAITRQCSGGSEAKTPQTTMDRC